MKEKITLRDAKDVMKLERMGARHQNRLSFMRILLRLLKTENWEFSKPYWEINESGIGFAVYEAKGPRRTYSLVAFTHDLPDRERSDRVIATSWDVTCTLFDGTPTEKDILRLYQNVPLQEAGRVSMKEISLSRANRSSRLWGHVVDSLANGKQPKLDEIQKVGYLLRTTAVYGSGKFGAGDRGIMTERVAFGLPFLVEMLSVYLTRSLSLDLVEHMAKMKGKDKAVKLSPDTRRQFGIGNSTGLGMAPFLVHHSVLIHSWVFVQEDAFRRIRSLLVASEHEQRQFVSYLKRAQLNAKQWNSQHELQSQKIILLRNDLQKLQAHIQTGVLNKEYPWQNLYLWAKDELSLEGQEQLMSLTMEPYGAIIDDLIKILPADEARMFSIDGSMNLHQLKKIIQDSYDWALDIDFNNQSHKKYIWYISVEKQEPRLGLRYRNDGSNSDIVGYEQPMAVARDICQLHNALKDLPGNMKVAKLLESFPSFRHIVRRVQIIAKMPYGEIYDNLIGEDLLPIDLLRFKLSHFGAIKFDPRSKLWVRICMYQNAPFPEELKYFPCDDWIYPRLDEGEEKS